MDIEKLVLTYSQMEHLRKLGLDTSDAALVLIYEDAEGNECEPDLVCYNEETNSYFFDNGERIELYPHIHDAENGYYDNSYKEDGQVYTLQEILDKIVSRAALIKDDDGDCETYIRYNNQKIWKGFFASSSRPYISRKDASPIKAAYEILVFQLEMEFIEKESRRKLDAEQNHKDVLDRVLRIVQEGYDHDATLESLIGEDIHFDSLDVVEFTMSLEKEFGISIPDNEMHSADQPMSVRDVAHYIVDKLKSDEK